MADVEITVTMADQLKTEEEEGEVLQTFRLGQSVSSMQKSIGQAFTLQSQGCFPIRNGSLTGGAVGVTAGLTPLQADEVFSNERERERKTFVISLG